MPRPKGSVNKITTEVKEQLQNLIDTVVNRIDVDAMTTDQKINLFYEQRSHSERLNVEDTKKSRVIQHYHLG